MNSKVCKICNVEKELGEFYVNAACVGGYQQRCKECEKSEARANYAKAGGRVEYERARSQKPERKAKVAEYQRKYRERSPEKKRARTAVSNAIRDGRLVRQPCGICGSGKAQAHHHDYRKPLDVLWRCFKCHREQEHGQTVR